MNLVREETDPHIAQKRHRVFVWTFPAWSLSIGFLIHMSTWTMWYELRDPMGP